MHLDIQVGEHAIDYANVAQKEKLSELQLRIRQLLDQVGQITKEQNYQRVISTRYTVLYYFVFSYKTVIYLYKRNNRDYFKYIYIFFSIEKNVLDKHQKALIVVYFGGLSLRLQLL